MNADPSPHLRIPLSVLVVGIAGAVVLVTCCGIWTGDLW